MLSEPSYHYSSCSKMFVAYLFVFFGMASVSSLWLVSLFLLASSKVVNHKLCPCLCVLCSYFLSNIYKLPVVDLLKNKGGDIWYSYRTVLDSVVHHQVVLIPEMLLWGYRWGVAAGSPPWPCAVAGSSSTCPVSHGWCCSWRARCKVFISRFFVPLMQIPKTVVARWFFFLFCNFSLWGENL
jgi:hypothetical protein